jgi:large subunit ribosomal protein L25
MKSITINGSQRESVGKVATKALRNAGKVPCVVYGGDKPVHFAANEIAFSKLVYTPNAHTAVIDLEGGAKINAILQDIQFHPVTDKILHVDFYQLFDDKEITMEIPVHVIGNPPGVLAGGVLRKNLRKIKVKALPANLPDFIDADVSELEIGNKLYITKLENEKFSFMHPDNTVVCQVRVSRAAMKASQDDDAVTEEATAATE